MTQSKTVKNTGSGQEVAKLKSKAEHSRFHVDYWKGRLYHKTFTKCGARHTIPEWSVRLQHLGRREAFALGSANANVAAAKAKEITTFLEANGWDATLAKFKPAHTEKAEVCTVGEFLADVSKRSHLKPATFRRYAVKLRKMVSDIAQLEAGMKEAERRAKFDYVNGGRKAWLARVDGQSLGALTRDSINEWRNRYVAKAGTDPISRKSVERSAASYLRCARALFTPEIFSVLQVKAASNPFAGLKLRDPGPQRYRSEISAEWLLSCADSELREHHPQQYLALVLCLWAGLRRKEADLLTWAQADAQQRQIHIRRTEHFEPKSDESERSIDLSSPVFDLIWSYKATSQSQFVLDGFEPDTSATYDYYRCDRTWRDLNAWLRAKGIKQRKAIHALRKESGSLVASQFGIEAARQHLGHRDIRTTSAHYVAKKKRIEVLLPLSGAGASFASSDANASEEDPSAKDLAHSPHPCSVASNECREG